MAHNITNNMIAWKNEKPWHGLGVEVNADATGEEMLVEAKLDWEVQRRKLAMETGVVGKNGKKGFVQEALKGYRAIVRADNDFVFQLATTDYHPMQNKEIVDFFREYCEAGHATMETVGGLKGGRMVWALAKLNGGSNAMVGKGDELRGYMLMATSHDGSIRTIGMPTTVRVVCWNTLSAAVGKYLKSRGEKVKISTKQAKQEGVFLMKHSRKWTPEVAKEAKETMGMAIEQVQETNELASTLSKIAIDDAGRLEFMVRLMSGESLVDQIVTDSSKSLLDQIADSEDKDPMKLIGRIGKGILDAMIDSPGCDLPTAKDTMWGALNGVTYYADHLRGKNQDQRLYGSWFGPGNTRKQRAVSILLDMAGKNNNAAA
jgi:phage/plasmid-like protein (TIGR03299 family)